MLYFSLAANVLAVMFSVHCCSLWQSRHLMYGRGSTELV